MIEKITKEGYRSFLATMYEEVLKSETFLALDPNFRINLKRLSFELVKELYKLDNEKENTDD